jgi:hypothetical protein
MARSVLAALPMSFRPSLVSGCEERSYEDSVQVCNVQWCDVPARSDRRRGRG